MGPQAMHPLLLFRALSSLLDVTGQVKIGFGVLVLNDNNIHNITGVLSGSEDLQSVLEPLCHVSSITKMISIDLLL